jgi:hypothetical protein
MSTHRESWYCCVLVHGGRRLSAPIRAWSAEQAVAEFRIMLGPEWAEMGTVHVELGIGVRDGECGGSYAEDAEGAA